jgi:outer membrane lipoprotein SlyB
MKKIILIVAVAASFAACKNKSGPGYDTSRYMLVDTTGMVVSTPATDVMKSAGVTATRTMEANKIPLTTSTSTENARTTSNAVYPANTSTTTTTTTTSTVPKRDKGWSSAAKGTVIGAGTGAVVGAIATHSVKGAIIGTVLGGGAGYLIGRHKDRKSGRVARARARRAAGY